MYYAVVCCRVIQIGDFSFLGLILDNYVVLATEWNVIFQGLHSFSLVCRMY